jgi:hypothetical protein
LNERSFHAISICKDVQLVMRERQGIEIDCCPQCRGVRLDRGERDKLIERSVVEQAPSPQSAASVFDFRQDHGAGRQGKLYRKKASGVKSSIKMPLPEACRDSYQLPLAGNVFRGALGMAVFILNPGKRYA